MHDERGRPKCDDFLFLGGFFATRTYKYTMHVVISSKKFKFCEQGYFQVDTEPQTENGKK